MHEEGVSGMETEADLNSRCRLPGRACWNTLKPSKAQDLSDYGLKLLGQFRQAGPGLPRCVDQNLGSLQIFMV